MKKQYTIIAFCIISIIACKNEEKKLETDQFTSAEKNIDEGEKITFYENKEAFFGETHLHTKYSLDAFIGGNRMSPDQALKFAQGQEVLLENTGKTMQQATYLLHVLKLL